MRRVATTKIAESARLDQSKSIPTDTKNNTANASRRGSASVAARRENSDLPTTIPARNAPRAMETSNRNADPTAIHIAIARIERVNSSREPVFAIFVRSLGMTHPPTTNVNPTSRRILTVAIPTAVPIPVNPTTELPNTAGSRTRTKTVNKSSITSHPIAI